MAELSAKENYLRLAKGEMPEYVPVFTMFGMPYKGVMATKTIRPDIYGDNHRTPEGGVDSWGVTYIANEETGFASIPEPNNFLLKDITEWEKVIKTPKMPDSIDWEIMAKKDIEESEIDRSKTALVNGAMLMPFQQLMAFMGFNEGLMAMYEEPQAVKDLLHFMADFYVPYLEKTLDAYKPDLYYMLDDTAAKDNPFVSVEMYRDILKPVYQKLAAPANERGIPIQFHNCGRCEDYVEDMIDFGVKYWDPAQTTNDLLAVKERYKGKIAICGGWDYKIPDSWPIVDEQDVRAEIRDIFDKYATGGGYAFCGGVLGRHGDQMAAQVNEWAQNEAYLYGRILYNK